MDATKFSGTSGVCGNGDAAIERRGQSLPFVGNDYTPDSLNTSYWDCPASGSFESAQSAGGVMALLLFRQCCMGTYREGVPASMAPAAMIQSWSERLAQETPGSSEHVSLMRQMHGFMEFMTRFALVGAAAFGHCLTALSEDEMIDGMNADFAMSDGKVLQ